MIQTLLRLAQPLRQLLDFVIAMKSGTAMDEELFLNYLPSLVEITPEQADQIEKMAQSISLFNPISPSTLDPKDPDLLDKMFLPCICRVEAKSFMCTVSKAETSRSELEALEQSFDEALQTYQARRSGICPIRERLHNQLFDEIIRQATVNLPERGILLMRVRDNLKSTFAAYQTLYEGSLVFASRKAHVAESGAGRDAGKAELEARLAELEAKKVTLQNKVGKPTQKILLSNELHATQQAFKEVTTIEGKARSEEIVYLNNQTKRLEEYLNGIYGD